MELKSGMVVKVFQNPIEGSHFEGKAILKKRYRPDEGDGLSMWWVEFQDEPGAKFMRTINAANAEVEAT